LTCGVPQESVLGSVLLLIYCADVIAIARRRGLEMHLYADDTQLYFHADPTEMHRKMQQPVALACTEEISQWMSANRLTLNKDKMQFIWLGTSHQMSQFCCQSVTLRGVSIQISTDTMKCLGVLLDDSMLTFAPHVSRLSSRCFITCDR